MGQVFPDSIHVLEAFRGSAPSLPSVGYFLGIVRALAARALPSRSRTSQNGRRTPQSGSKTSGRSGSPAFER